jgi:hypothetical protein
MPKKTVEDIILRNTSLNAVKKNKEDIDTITNVNNDNMIIDNVTIPFRNHKISIDGDTASTIQNFDDEYNNIFVNKRKDSYEINFSDHFLINDRNQDLLKQYQLLENVFEQVYEYSNQYQNFSSNHKIDMALENKRQLLSNKLKSLKEDYINIIKNNVNNADLLKKSMINQIEVLIDLINTIKLKIIKMQSNAN